MKNTFLKISSYLKAILWNGFDLKFEFGALLSEINMNLFLFFCGFEHDSFYINLELLRF